MNQSNEGNSNRKTLMSLVLATLVIIGILCFLNSYQNVSCSMLCLSNFSSKGNYAISATMTHSSEELRNRTVLVTINNAYKAAITTNGFSSLQFQAPLKLGINTLRFQYANSGASVSFFYFGGMLYALLIPLGAIFFLIMKLLASNISNKNRVVFYFNDKLIPEAEEDGIRYAVNSLEQKTKRAIVNLPERICDLTAELQSINGAEGRKRMQKDVEYLSQKIEILGIAKPMFGHISRLTLSKQIIGARIFYENAIVSGSGMSLISRNAERFITANNIILLDDFLTNRAASPKLRKGKIHLALFSPLEYGSLSNTIKSYSVLGSLLLMMKLNCTLELLRAW